MKNYSRKVLVFITNKKNYRIQYSLQRMNSLFIVKNNQRQLKFDNFCELKNKGIVNEYSVNNKKES